MRIALVANSRSGGRDRRGDIRSAVARLRVERILAIPFETHYRGHAFDIAHRLDIAAYDAVVAMGGDGTNYDVLNGLLKGFPDSELPPLGVIPAGRGNSFARDLGVFSVEDGIRALARRTTRAVDVCRFTQNGEPFYFINLMGFGFVTEVARTAARFSRAGDMSYVIGVLYRLLGLRFPLLHAEIDGRTVSGEFCFVEICNSRFTGGSMLMAPDAVIDDGWFDVVLASRLSRIRLLATFPKIFKGTHGENPAVTFTRAKEAVFRTRPVQHLLPDGEIFGTTPTRVRILPGRVRYFA